MKKITIGIFPKVNIHETNSPFDDTYIYSNNIIEQLNTFDAIPLCLTIKNNQVLEEQLKKCDAFILPGGKKINPAAYYLLKYAYENKIPVLGICLGMQTLAVFSILIKEPEWNNQIFTEIENKVIQKLEDNNHHQISATYDNLSKSIHNIFIEPTSKLYEYVNKQIIPVYSFHNYHVIHIDKMFKVTSLSEDKILESIESNRPDWLVLGVQFHPELNKNDIIIKNFLKDVDKLKKE